MPVWRQRNKKAVPKGAAFCCCFWRKLCYNINKKRVCRQTVSPGLDKLNEISRLCLEALGGFSHAFRAITHNAKTKINAKKSYFVIGVAPFQGLSFDRLPRGKHLFDNIITIVYPFVKLSSSLPAVVSGLAP